MHGKRKPLFSYRMSNGLSEYTCELAMDIDVVMKRRNGVPYKYCVINSHHEDEFEYLHGLPTPSFGVRNRCLMLYKGIYSYSEKSPCKLILFGQLLFCSPTKYVSISRLFSGGLVSGYGHQIP